MPSIRPACTTAQIVHGNLGLKGSLLSATQSICRIPDRGYEIVSQHGIPLHGTANDFFPSTRKDKLNTQSWADQFRRLEWRFQDRKKPPPLETDSPHQQPRVSPLSNGGGFFLSW